MECNEKFLRQLLESPYRDAVAQAILERLSHGFAVTVSTEQGEKLKLQDCQDAMRILGERFGWNAPHEITYSLPPATRPGR